MALVGRGWSGVDAQSFVRVSTMFVASQAQLKRLLDRAAAPQAQWLLDIGAGRGEPTSALAAALKIARADHVVALEASAPLRRELRWRRGYRGIAKLEEAAGSGPFDVVALLNVLDRVDDPERMLRAAARQLQPRGGLLVVASVLPFRGSVQLPPPANRDRRPRRPLELERIDGGPVRGRRRAARFGRNASRAIADGGGAASAEARFGGTPPPLWARCSARRAAARTDRRSCSRGRGCRTSRRASVAWTYSLLEHAIFVVRVAGKAPGASGPAQSRQINLRAASSSPITCERRAACANARGGGGRRGALASDARVPLGGARRHGRRRRATAPSARRGCRAGPVRALRSSRSATPCSRVAVAARARRDSSSSCLGVVWPLCSRYGFFTSMLARSEGGLRRRGRRGPRGIGARHGGVTLGRVPPAEAPRVRARHPKGAAAQLARLLRLVGVRAAERHDLRRKARHFRLLDDRRRERRRRRAAEHARRGSVEAREGSLRRLRGREFGRGRVGRRRRRFGRIGDARSPLAVMGRADA